VSGSCRGTHQHLAVGCFVVHARYWPVRQWPVFNWYNLVASRLLAFAGPGSSGGALARSSVRSSMMHVLQKEKAEAGNGGRLMGEAILALRALRSASQPAGGYSLVPRYAIMPGPTKKCGGLWEGSPSTGLQQSSEARQGRECVRVSLAEHKRSS